MWWRGYEETSVPEGIVRDGRRVSKKALCVCGRRVSKKQEVYVRG